MDLGRCFLNHQYESVVELVNQGELPVKYELVNQVSFDFYGIILSGLLPIYTRQLYANFQQDDVLKNYRKPPGAQFADFCF